jgi:hypothetical protein
LTIGTDKTTLQRVQHEGEGLMAGEGFEQRVKAREWSALMLTKSEYTKTFN